MEFHESKEDYLEAILVLKNMSHIVRSIDIANFLNYSRPSVSIAMKQLKEEGLINIDGNHHITLTDAGFEIADKIYDRHVTITKFLSSIGVNPEIAEKDACKIEHIISQETFDRIKELKNKVF